MTAWILDWGIIAREFGGNSCISNKTNHMRNVSEVLHEG
jgi:hypothetical protein